MSFYNYKKNALLTLWILLCPFCWIIGQEYYFKNYKVENGLSHNTVLCSIQDEHGFLWFGTKDGLNRFDGYSFKVFEYDVNNPNSLGSNYIECLHEYNGKIWVGTDSGLFCYDEHYESFEFIDASMGLPILDIDHDDQGNLWFVSGKSLVKYEVENEKSFQFDIERYFRVVDITRDFAGGIWAIYANSLHRYDERSKNFISFEITLGESDVPSIRINKVVALDNNTLLLGTQKHGVLSFNISSHKVTKLLYDDKTPLFVRDILVKNKSELWVATESGLFIYDLENGTYTNLKKSINNPYALSDNALYCVTSDNEGGVWIGSYFGGINYYPKQYYQFRKFFPIPGKNSITGNAVREIVKDSMGNLWIGTEDAGLNKYDPGTGLFTNYAPSDSDFTLSDYNIHGIFAKGNRLWVGTFQHGLDILDITTGKVVKHYGLGDGHGLTSNFIFSFYEDDFGNLFVVTGSGILTYDFESDTFIAVEAFPKDTHFTAVMRDHLDVLWAGTYWDGLITFNPNTKKKRIFRHDKNDRNSISGNNVNGIFQDSKNRIWITTEKGLNLYRRDSNDFKTYTVEDGFPSNVFYSIIEVDDWLWISTSKGLVKFNPETEEKRIYTKANGLLSDQFNYNSAYKDDNGTLYFGSVAGLVSFNPLRFKNNTGQAPIYLTSLQVNNEDIEVSSEGSPLKQSLIWADKINLNPDQTSFNIGFAALGYTAPETTEYWYKMEGLNDDWIGLKKNHNVSFTEIPAGNYLFKVKSMNNDGTWSKESKAIQIKVSPIFWKSNLAYLLYILIISTITILGFGLYHQRNRIKNIQRIRQLNYKKEKELYKAKIEFFTNVSHEIRTPLTLIKSPLEIIIRKSKEFPGIVEDLTIIEKNTNRLLDLVNQLLDFRKTETERVNLTYVETNITELLKEIIGRFGNAIEERGIIFDLNMVDQDIYAYVDAEALRKILSNLITNAIKYADNNVNVQLKTNAESLTLTMANDGNIIPAHLKETIFEPFYRMSGVEKHSGTGIGLALAKSLTEMHQGSLTLDVSRGTENCFVLTLPIRQEKEFVLWPKRMDQRFQNYNQPNERLKASGETNVLLVEDSEELLDFIAKELKEEYAVFKASNGNIALQILEVENIHLIISDVMMPGMDGFTLCKNLRTNLETSHIPIILLTSKSAMAAKMEGLESGADAYMEKPFSMRHLKAHITNLLENRKHILEHYTSSPLAHIRSIAHTKTDETFIKKLDKVIYENMADHKLNVEVLAEIMNISRSTLYRKIKEISNLTPNELINITRLKRSAELLKTGKYRIFEVAEIVGYNSSTSFGRNFQKQFEMTPTEYMQGKEVQ